VEKGVRLLMRKGRWMTGMKNKEMNEFVMLSIVHLAEGIPKKRFNMAGVCMISTISHCIVGVERRKNLH
jgi:hypothetical protein